MPILADLGYVYQTPNGFQRSMQKVASSKPGSAFFSRVLPKLDSAVLKASKGKATMVSFFAGVPVLWLTTTGAKSGEERTAPLLGIPYGDDVALIGSNWGGQKTPGWVLNLEAHPQAVVGYRDRSVAARARRADRQETDEIFGRAASLYPGYASYRDRASHRTIRVFVLSSQA